MKVVEINSSLILSNIESTYEEVLAQISTDDNKVKLDLSAVDVIDTSGVQMIEFLKTKFPDTEFFVGELQPSVERGFELLGFKFNQIDETTEAEVA